MSKTKKRGGWGKFPPNIMKRKHEESQGNHSLSIKRLARSQKGRKVILLDPGGYTTHLICWS